MSKKIRGFMICASLILTGLLYLKIPFELSRCWDITIDIAAMFGSGAFISVLFDIIISMHEKKKKNEQRKYVLSIVKQRFRELLRRELQMISLYYEECIQQVSRSWSNEELQVDGIGDKLVKLVQSIQDEKRKKEDVHVIINADTIKKADLEDKYLITNNCIYYERLLQALMQVSSESTTYLISEILTQSQVEQINDLVGEIQDIVSFSGEQRLENDTVLEFKKILFEKTQEIVGLLDIRKEKILCHYRK